MSAKKFQSLMVNTTQWVEIVKGSAGYDATVTIHVCNHNNSNITVDMALTSASPITLTPDQDIFELGKIIYANNSRMFPGIVLPQGASLAIRGSSINYSVLVYGYEEKI